MIQNRTLSWLLPLLSLTAGAVLVIGVATASRRAGSLADLSVKEKFQKLTPKQQELLLRRADFLQHQKQSNPAEYQRLLQWHQDTQDNPSLIGRLQKFQQWWQSLKPEQARQLLNDGQFQDNWVAKADLLYQETRSNREVIEVNFRRFGDAERSLTFSYLESDFENFLTSVLPNPLPEDLNARLNELSPDCDRTLKRLLWLMSHIKSPFSRLGSDRDAEVALSDLRRGFEEHLIRSEQRPEYEGLLEQFRISPREDDPRGLFVFGLFMEAALEHYADEFNQKYIGNQRDGLIDLFARQAYEAQTNLMKLGASDAERSLQQMLIESSHAQDPAVAQLAEELRVAQARIASRGFNRGRSGPGGPGRGGRDGPRRD